MSATMKAVSADCEPGHVLPLPELPASQQGTSTASHRNYKASVSNAAGYLCHIELECTFDVPPQVIFDIFCHPDNAGAFRDIKMVGYRKVKVHEPGYKVIEVEQCGELRVLWISRIFRTYLDVTEDARDPECLKTDFKLLRSDLLARFHGSWDLQPKRDATGNTVGCHAVLKQDVLPKGVPSFFAHLPVLGGLLRRVSLNTIQRLVEDILNIVNKYTAAKGQKSLDDIMAEIAAERGHTTAATENRGRSNRDCVGDLEPHNETSDNNNTKTDHNHIVSFALDTFSEGDSSEGDLEETEHAAVTTHSAGTSSVGVLKQRVANVAVDSKQHGRHSWSGDKVKQLGKGDDLDLEQLHVDEGAPVGVMIDVSVHGHVDVGLIPTPELCKT